MTETTPTLLAARDALAGALHDVRDGDEHAPWTAEPCRYCDRLADALLASGVVRDVATLADDETLVERMNAAQWDVDMGDVEWRGTRRTIVQHLRALAAALGGDQ